MKNLKLLYDKIFELINEPSKWITVNLSKKINKSKNKKIQ